MEIKLAKTLAATLLQLEYMEVALNTTVANGDPIPFKVVADTEIIAERNNYLTLDATFVNAYNPTGVINIKNTDKTVIKVTDVLGQETPYRRNTPLFYIYDDGKVEKTIIVE